MVQLPQVSREELRRRASRPENPAYDLPFAKSALTQAIARNVFTAQEAGRDLQQAARATTGSFERGGVPEVQQVFESRSLAPPRRENTLAQTIASAQFDYYQDMEQWRHGVDFSDQVSAAWGMYTATAGIKDLISRERFQPDPDFNYMEHRESLEEGLSYSAVMHLRGNARSLDEAQYLRAYELEREEQERILGAHGAGQGLVAGLVGGVADPLGWAAGLGVGKALHLGGVGSRALWVSGRSGAAVGSIVAESAAANIAIEAIRDAAGQRVDATDYAYSAAFGAAFGVALSPVAFRGYNRQAAQQQFENIMAEARRTEARLYETAASNLGPGASAEDIAAEVGRLHAVEGANLDHIRLAMPGEQDRFMATPRTVDGDPSTVPPVDTTPTNFDREIGVDTMLTTDPLRAKMVAETHQRAEAWVSQNPVDEARLRDLLGRVERLSPSLSSTAQNLLRSEHPVARMISGLLLENTTGAAGRRSSAAIDKAMTERVYMGEIEKLPHLYRVYRREHGGSGIRDTYDQRLYRQFNREVAEFRELRARGAEPETVHPAVRAAGDMLDRFYDRPRRDQIAVSTPGHEGLPNTSVGYAPRRLDPERFQSLTNAQRRAVQAEYARQLRLAWDDPEFADMVAARMIEHGRIAAAGGKEIPANLYSASAAPLLRNALRNTGRGQLKLTDPEIEELVKRISTRGPAYTKARMDLDTLAEIRDPETGESFRLMDLYDNDQMRLAQNYARRASGEVALAKYGVMGEEGLTILRESLTFGRDGQRLTGRDLDNALQAFDQIAAEFLGRPFGTSKWFRSADNLRLLTASSRLGGMAFTQFGEYANALPVLGANHTLSAIRAFPRIISDLRAGRESPILGSIERVGGEIGTDWKVNFPYQNLSDTFVHGQESMGVFTRVVRNTANAVPHLNGWHYVHAAQQRGMAEQIIHKAVKAVRRGDVDTKALDDMGFNEAVRTAMRRDMDRIARFDSKGNLVEFDIDGFADPAVARDFVQSVHRGAKQIIQGTFIGETGYWAHNDLLRILTQFRTFSLVSMEKQWTRQAAMHGGIKTFGYLLGALSWALPIHLARVQINSLGRTDRDEYLEQQLNPLVLGRAVLNYASLSGLASDMLDVGTAMVGMFEGVLGVDAGLEMHGVRGISDGDLGAVIPSLGYANSTLRALTSGNPQNLLRSLPGGNIPWAVPLVNAITAKERDDQWDLTDF